MLNSVMPMLAEITGGKSYKAHKYSLDHTERPNIDYAEDCIVWKETKETIPHRKYVSLDKERSKVSVNGEQLLTYFLDGSRRVYKVDDIAYSISGRSSIYPVIAGQIGVGCTRRESGLLTIEKFKQEFVISMPNMANADGKSGFFAATAQKLNSCSSLRNLHLKFSTILPYKTDIRSGRNFEDRGTACIQNRMIEREKEMVAELVREGKLNQDNYLIKDGSLEYIPSEEDKSDRQRYRRFKNNYNWVLGVSKSFNPEACVDINGKPNAGFIADLPLFHRTPVAGFMNTNILDDIKFAVWYVRIRDKTQTRTPFDGVLKIEKMLVTHEEEEFGIDSELVDTLTAHIINERCPVCYGSDLRWANHLYPVYLTESFVKSKYLSTESFLHLF